MGRVDGVGLGGWWGARDGAGEALEPISQRQNAMCIQPDLRAGRILSITESL